MEEAGLKEKAESDLYSDGFENALRSVVAALDEVIMREDSEEVLLGLAIARRITLSYQGWMRKQKQTS